ncbi:MAG: WD40 repeat domain-containing protein [Promethearchaeota archaeon]
MQLKVKHGIDCGHFIYKVAVSPDSKYVATGSEDKTIKILEISTGELIQTLEGHKAGVYGVEFTPNQKTIMSGSWDRTAKSWDVET